MNEPLPSESTGPRGTGFTEWLGRFWDGIGRRWLPGERHFEDQRRVDPFGARVHLACGLITCLMLGGPTSVAELALIPAGAAMLIRLHRFWRTWGSLLMQPLVWFWAMACCWGVIALAWSPDRSQGWGELSLTRWASLALMLWPVMDRRWSLLVALIVGLHLGQLTQLGHVIGVAMDVPWLRWNRMPGRWSGWWDPVVGGSLLVGLLGLHLPAALWGRGCARWSGISGSMAAAAGLIATGTRGAWLASMGLVACAVVCLWWGSRHRLLLAASTLAVVLIAGGGLVGLLAATDSPLGDRVRAAVTEVQAAASEGDFTTDTGARIGMALWAGRALASSPIVGVGTGGYQAWVFEQTGGPIVGIHPHAHNALAHIAATGGVIGAALCLLVFASALSSASRPVAGDGPAGYAMGPAFALVGLGLVTAFDPIHLNTQTCALFAALVVLRLPNRPRIEGGRLG